METGKPERESDELHTSNLGTAHVWLNRAEQPTDMLGPAARPIGRTEDILRTLFRALEQAADLVVITDNSGTIEYANAAFEKLTGYSRAEAVGQTPRILKSGEQSPEFYRDLWHTIRTGDTFRAVVVNRKKSGEFYIVVAGEIAHFVLNDRDISECRRLESGCFRRRRWMRLASWLEGSLTTSITF